MEIKLLHLGLGVHIMGITFLYVGVYCIEIKFLY